MTITLRISLRSPIARGTSRKLTAAEARTIRALTSLRPYVGYPWRIARNDDGYLTLNYCRYQKVVSWAIH